MNFPSRLTSQTVQSMLYTNVVPVFHRRTTTGSSLPVTKTFPINVEEEVSLVCHGVHRFRRNLVPRVLSLLRESTLVTAGHVSARF